MNVSDYPTAARADLPSLSEDQMIEVDRVMVDELHIELIQMMENAGRNLARLALDLANPASAVVYAGSGGNGGGGMVAARHLANAGVDVQLVLSRPAEELSGVPRHQRDILAHMGVPSTDRPPEADLTIDALIGYSLRGAPAGRTGQLISAIRERSGPILALDTPSGLDVTDGTTPGGAVSADATLTLAAPKRGLHEAEEVGELFVADISVPQLVFRNLGLRAPDFRAGAILRIVDSAHQEG